MQDTLYTSDTLLKMNLQLFAKDGPGGEKTEPATAKKLNDIRKEGQVAKSKEIITAISLMALFIILKVYVGGIGTKLVNGFKTIYGMMQKVVFDSAQGITVRMAGSIVREAFTLILGTVIPVLIVAVIIAVLGNMLQQKWMVTAKPLAPKASKINPMNGFKRMFSVRQLFELLKSIAMIAIIGIMVYNSVRKNMNIILTFYDVTLYTALSTVGNIIINLGIQISAVFLVIGFIDLIYQRHKFKTDNMMTKQEIKDEFKNTEGDPQVKGQIRRRMQEISRRRMMQQLPEADVVITNPTHFAVALKYEPDSGKAPVVIAKGADYLAFQIRDKAKEYNISIVENKPLARIIYHNVDIGMEIPPELYYAVAEILASVLRANNR